MKNKFQTLQREEDRNLFERRMLTTKEAAFYLGLSVRTVRGKAAKGILTSYRPWKKELYFEISDLDEYLFSRKRNSSEKLSEKASLLNYKTPKKWKI